MIIIRDVLISDDLIEEKFHCHLSSCKGACCWEGDFGAPLENPEIEVLNQILPKIRPYLSERSIALIEREGFHQYYKEPNETGTSLHPNGACVFLTKNEQGQYRCGIELAWQDGKVNFRKPISCHLYPIRRKSNSELGFEALNYDRWEICSAACSYGEKLKLPLYQFAKEALVRLYGNEFYEELDAAAAYLQKT